MKSLTKELWIKAPERPATGKRSFLEYFLLSFLLTVVAVVVLLVLVFTVLLLNYEGPFPRVIPRPFDHQLWKSWSKEDMHQSADLRRSLLRRDMLEDLLSRQDFKGWTPKELEQLLGPSNPDFCPEDWDISYLVGTSWVDYVLLVFRLDKNGNVEAYQEIMI